MKFKSIPIRGAKKIQISVKGEISDLAKLVESPSSTSTPGEPAKSGPPVNLSLAVALDGIPRIRIEAASSVNLSEKAFMGGIAFTLVGGECQFNVPTSAIAKIKEGFNLLRKFSSTSAEVHIKELERSITDFPVKTPDPLLKEKEKVTKAFEEYGSGPKETQSAKEPITMSDVIDIVNAVDSLYQAIKMVDEQKGKCKKGPTIKIGPQLTIPFGDDEERKPTSAGAFVTGEF
jgi:hypothetical protein